MCRYLAFGEVLVITHIWCSEPRDLVPMDGRGGKWCELGVTKEAGRTQLS
jgi:hypothetical protein